MESWKASFLRANVHCEKESTTHGDDSQQFDYATADPLLEREVETIRNLVKSYVKIVSKTFKDLVPKYITKLIINSMKDFIVGDTLYILLNDLYANGGQSTLMDMSGDEERRKEDVLRLYNAINDALNKINDVSMTTQYTEMQPPITRSKLHVDGTRNVLRSSVRGTNPPPRPSSTYESSSSVQQKVPPLIPSRPVPAIPKK